MKIVLSLALLGSMAVPLYADGRKGCFLPEVLSQAQAEKCLDTEQRLRDWMRIWKTDNLPNFKWDWKGVRMYYPLFHDSSRFHGRVNWDDVDWSALAGLGYEAPKPPQDSYVWKRPKNGTARQLNPANLTDRIEFAEDLLAAVESGLNQEESQYRGDLEALRQETDLDARLVKLRNLQSLLQSNISGRQRLAEVRNYVAALKVANRRLRLLVDSASGM